MAPSLVRVKRRREDEPVESLYLEARHERKRRETADVHVFRRVQDEGIESTTSTLKPSAPPPIPKDALAKPSVPTIPRRFHLSRRAPSVAQTRPASVLSKRRDRDQDVAVFVEAARPASRRKLDLADGKVAGLSDAKPASHADREDETMDIEVATPTSRKRPNAGKAEKEWREKNWKPVDASAKAAAPSEADMSLLGEMQAFAEEEQAKAEELEQKTAKTVQPTVFRTPMIKAVPRATHPEQRPSDNVKDEDGDVGMLSDDEYVYDTYIRDDAALLRELEMQKESIGVLVIDDEDLDLWETYQDDEPDSDKDWNSEEEDENAEDWYGADYPEDEVASDDEHDNDAYKYRHDALEGDEFDSDPAFSDEEGELERPWKQPSWAKPRKSFEIEKD